MSANVIRVVGAGISGATIARLLAEKGYKVEVYEKRNEVGGNCADYKKDEYYVQKYGPHIFHTNSDAVYRFVKKFTAPLKYEHNVEGFVNGKLINIPVNLNSVSKYFKPKKAKRICTELIKTFVDTDKITVADLQNSESKILNEFGNFVFKNVFKKYTEKQWGTKIENVDSSVLARVPIRVNFNDSYFDDKYVFMPDKGFSEMINEMLNHKNIQVFTNTDVRYSDTTHTKQSTKWIVTSRLDSFFDYKFGELPYNSLKFKFCSDKKKRYDRAVTNFNTSKKYTRITSFANFYGSNTNDRVICKEYPVHFKNSYNESELYLKEDKAYYPILNAANRQKADRYLELAKESKIEVLGRFAEYEYLDMDDCVLNALKLARKFKGVRR